MSADISLIDLGDWGPAATVFIEKISEAVGGLCKPWQIRRVAQAKTEAALIKKQGEIEIRDIERRAVNRFVAEEAKKQDNMERITEKAIPQLTDTAAPENMEDDWITNFFDKCRIVSDEEMQSLWAKVLSGEANSPGTFSKRTVNFLASLDKADAALFTTLCRFAWWTGSEVIPLIYEIDAPIYKENGVNYASLIHLDDIGLISLQNSPASFVLKGQPQRGIILYYGTPLLVEFAQAEDNDLKTGQVLLTRTGRQLAPICGSKRVDGFEEYVIDIWVREGLIVASPYPRGK
ncbi:MAG: DUF2806 domain-containing protein [Desulfomonile tiedjei]|nr:DUF2806 domain-containing protein [Desulfomonile tiedjei]